MANRTAWAALEPVFPNSILSHTAYTHSHARSTRKTTPGKTSMFVSRDIVKLKRRGRRMAANGDEEARGRVKPVVSRADQTNLRRTILRRLQPRLPATIWKWHNICMQRHIMTTTVSTCRGTNDTSAHTACTCRLKYYRHMALGDHRLGRLAIPKQISCGS